MKLIHRATAYPSTKTAMVSYHEDLNEYRVIQYDNKERTGVYYTNDREDALLTAQAYVRSSDVTLH